MSEVSKLAPWQKTPCEACGLEFLATRTRERDRPEKGWLCEGCESYQAGLREGQRLATSQTPNRVSVEEVLGLGWNSIKSGPEYAAHNAAVHAQQLYLIGRLLVEIRDLLVEKA